MGIYTGAVLTLDESLSTKGGALKLTNSLSGATEETGGGTRGKKRGFTIGWFEYRLVRTLGRTNHSRTDPGNSVRGIRTRFVDTKDWFRLRMEESIDRIEIP